MNTSSEEEEYNKSDRVPLLDNYNDEYEVIYSHEITKLTDLQENHAFEYSVSYDSKAPEPEESVHQESSPPSLSISRAHVKHTTGDLSAMTNFLKGMIGSGILALPSAMQNAGLWTGFTGLILMGTIATHCMHMLVHCSHKICVVFGKSEMSYEDLAEFAVKNSIYPRVKRLSNLSRMLVTGFLCVTQFGFCIVYILFIADTIKKVVYDIKHWEINIQYYQAMVTLLIIPIILIRKLKILAWLALFANVVTWTGLFVIFYFCFTNLKPTSQFEAFNSWKTLAIFFGTIVYAFEGVGLVLPIENKMKRPELFVGPTGVLNTGMILVICLDAGMAFFGFVACGKDIKASITLNLPHTPFYGLVQGLFALSMLVSYPLQFYVPWNIILPVINNRMSSSPRIYRKAVEYSVKISIVILTFVLAALIPHMDLVISLIGAFASSALALIFPPLLDIIVRSPLDLGKFKWMLWKDIAIIIIGLLLFVISTAVVLSEIIQVLGT